MSWLSDAWDTVTSTASAVGDAVASGADAVAGAVEDTVNAVGDAVAGAVETVGNAIDDGLNAVADFVSGIPIIGGALSGFLRWVGGVASAACDLAAAGVKALAGVIAGSIAGAIRIAAGILTLHGSLIVKGLVDIGSSFVGGFFFLLGKFAALVQTIAPVETRKRKLTDAEMQLLKRVFHDSVSLYDVRIVTGFAGVFSLTEPAFTLGNTIYMKSTDPTASPDVLVHECTHVWQYQHRGDRYIGDALGAMAVYGRDAAYSWEDELKRGHTRWIQLNAEAAAKLVQDVFNQGSLLMGGSVQSTGNGVFYDANGKSVGQFIFNDTDRTALANDAVRTIRGVTSFRLARLVP